MNYGDRNRPGNGKKAAASGDPNVEEKEMQALVGSLVTKESQKFISSILRVAHRSPSARDRQDIVKILSVHGVRDNPNNREQVIKAINQFRADHPKKEAHIPEAVDEKLTPEEKEEKRRRDRDIRNMQREGGSASPEDYLGAIEIALEKVAALDPLKKPYFGKKVNETEPFVPPELEQAAEVVERAGWNFDCILDHLLISKSFASFSPIRTVQRIFPVESGSDVSEAVYRSALKEIAQVAENGASDEAKEMLALSAERVGAIYLEDLSPFFMVHFFRSNAYPFTGGTGRILEVYPGIQAAAYFRSLKGSASMHILSKDMWEATVFGAVASGINPNAVEISNRTLRELPLNEYYGVIHINGDRFISDRSQYAKVQQMTALLQPGACMVIDFVATPANRLLAGSEEFYKFLAGVVKDGSFEVKYQLGRTAMLERPDNLGPIFYPSSYSERDRIVFEKRAKNGRPEDDLKQIDRITELFDTLTLFQDPIHWEYLYETLSGLSGLEELGSIAKFLDKDFDNAKLKEAATLLKQGNFEELAVNVIKNHIFRGFQRNKVQILGEVLSGFQSGNTYKRQT